MSVEEIKNRLVELSLDERNQVSAYLLHLRNAADPDYRAEMTARLDDRDPSHWLTLDEFERRLDQKQGFAVTLNTIYLHINLLDTIPASGLQRRKILDFIRSLQDQPNVLGDFMESNDSHRMLRTKIVGKYAVTYWLDDPARSVIITKVQLAG